jgi:hypothetical protein
VKITIESTSKLVELRTGAGGVLPARVWEGQTESGVPVHCFITRIAVHKHRDTSQFDRELQEHRAPSADVEAYPGRLII